MLLQDMFPYHMNFCNKVLQKIMNAMKVSTSMRVKETCFNGGQCLAHSLTNLALNPPMIRLQYTLRIMNLIFMIWQDPFQAMHLLIMDWPCQPF